MVQIPAPNMALKVAGSHRSRIPMFRALPADAVAGITSPRPKTASAMSDTSETDRLAVNGSSPRAVGSRLRALVSCVNTRLAQQRICAPSRYPRCGSAHTGRDVAPSWSCFVPGSCVPDSREVGGCLDGTTCDGLGSAPWLVGRSHDQTLPRVLGRGVL